MRSPKRSSGSTPDEYALKRATPMRHGFIAVKFGFDVGAESTLTLTIAAH
jgi:hypothetical protein